MDENVSFHPEHPQGCPARYGDGDCDERGQAVESGSRIERLRMHASGHFIPVSVDKTQAYVLTAKGLEALGFPALAAEQRAAAAERIALREQMKNRGYKLSDSPIDHDAGNDSPAGAGHDVEADRG